MGYFISSLLLLLLLIIYFTTFYVACIEKKISSLFQDFKIFGQLDNCILLWIELGRLYFIHL
jgi:hypothetical protein